MLKSAPGHRKVSDERYRTRPRRLFVLVGVAFVVLAVYLEPAPDEPWLAAAALGLSVVFAVMAEYLVFTLPHQHRSTRSAVRQLVFFALLSAVLWQYLSPVESALVLLVVALSLLVAVAVERLYLAVRRSVSQSTLSSP